jgi:hypothetical protein
MKKAHEHSHHGHTGITRHSPRNGFTAYFVLSPAIGLVCHRHLARLLARLDAGVEASEPHDFAVRISTVRQVRAVRVHRIPPRVRDVRNAPLWDGTARISELIWVRREQKYFCKWGWTGKLANTTDLPVGPISRPLGGS